MKNVAILGFGKLGKAILNATQQDPLFKQQFQVTALWNRTYAVLEQAEIPEHVTLYKELESLIENLEDIDLVIEAAHPSVMHQHGLAMLEHSPVFVSSPTAFADQDFNQQVRTFLKEKGQSIYIPLGASLGVWDIIRLDQNAQLETLEVEMKKHPESFKIRELKAVEALDHAATVPEEVVVAEGNITEINQIAPQNTNTMAIYALAASSLGFKGCNGRIVAGRELETHVVTCRVKNKSGLELLLRRDNPAAPGAVTGSATFGSFLNSLYYHSKGISHHHFVFC